jgi:hypothetical protein
LLHGGGAGVSGGAGRVPARAAAAWRAAEGDLPRARLGGRLSARSRAARSGGDGRLARIALANEAHIQASDALIANLTPFRGPSADPGTVFEVGFMRALGRPVFGWTATDSTLRARTADGAAADADGLAIEDFGLADNLMIPGAIAASGGALFAATLADPWGDLSLFEACVKAAAAALAG